MGFKRLDPSICCHPHDHVKLGDMYGRKKIFLGSLVLFVLASAVNGMASSLLILDIGRGVQAIRWRRHDVIINGAGPSNFEG